METLDRIVGDCFCGIRAPDGDGAARRKVLKRKWGEKLSWCGCCSPEMVNERRTPPLRKLNRSTDVVLGRCFGVRRVHCLQRNVNRFLEQRRRMGERLWLLRRDVEASPALGPYDQRQVLFPFSDN